VANAKAMAYPNSLEPIFKHMSFFFGVSVFLPRLADFFCRAAGGKNLFKPVYPIFVEVLA